MKIVFTCGTDEKKQAEFSRRLSGLAPIYNRNNYVTCFNILIRLACMFPDGMVVDDAIFMSVMKCSSNDFDAHHEQAALWMVNLLAIDTFSDRAEIQCGVNYLLQLWNGIFQSTGLEDLKRFGKMHEVLTLYCYYPQLEWIPPAASILELVSFDSEITKNLINYLFRNDKIWAIWFVDTPADLFLVLCEHRWGDAKVPASVNSFLTNLSQIAPQKAIDILTAIIDHSGFKAACGVGIKDAGTKLQARINIINKLEVCATKLISNCELKLLRTKLISAREEAAADELLNIPPQLTQWGSWWGKGGRVIDRTSSETELAALQGCSRAL